MKVFISWSKPRSRAVAEALCTWLKDVMQAVDPWISSENIRKGTRWSIELVRELEATHIGVICVTPENLEAPWLLFEGGALSKLHMERNAHVCTYLIDMPYSAVTGPLAEFQHTLAIKDDTYRLVQTINGAIADGEGRLTDAQLKRAFERCWSELKQCLDTLPEPEGPVPPPRKAEDMLQETLEIVRSLVNPRQLSATELVLGRMAQLLARVRSFKDTPPIGSREDVMELMREMKYLETDVEYFLQQHARDREKFVKLVEQLEQEVNRLSFIVGLPAIKLLARLKTKEVYRPPAAELKELISSESPTIRKQNKLVPNVRQARQRRRPS